MITLRARARISDASECRGPVAVAWHVCQWTGFAVPLEGKLKSIATTRIELNRTVPYHHVTSHHINRLYVSMTLSCRNAYLTLPYLSVNYAGGTWIATC